MNNSENEDKKIKTQIIPAIHNTVSLQFYLKTEDGQMPSGIHILLKLYSAIRYTLAILSLVKPK